MYFHPLSALSIFTFGYLCTLAMPFASPSWEDVYSKHAWHSVPEDWLNLGYPAANTTIDLRIALKAQHENALIDAFHEISSPDHPKCVLSISLPPTQHPPTCSATPADLADTYLKSRSPSLSRRPKMC